MSRTALVTGEPQLSADQNCSASSRAMRFIPHLVWLIGAVVLLVAFGLYSGASMPYQDPTPELLAVQHGHIESAKTVALIGFSIFIGGLAWVINRRRSR